LVKKNDPSACKLTVKLSGSKSTLALDNGCVLGPMWQAPKDAWHQWSYIDIGVGPSSGSSISVHFENEFIVWDGRHGRYVFDISMWKLEEGNHLVLVKGVGVKAGNTMNESDNKGRKFVQNDDGTISPSHARHLCLGAEGMPSTSSAARVGGAASNGSQRGRIEFLGLWKDTGDRAMPIKINVNPGNSNQMREGVENLLRELQSSGNRTGLVAFQSYNQIHWSSSPNDQGYKKHGFISMGPPSKSSWSKRRHTSEGITFSNLDGRIDILGGNWQNAVYRVTLDDEAMIIAEAVLVDTSNIKITEIDSLRSSDLDAESLQQTFNKHSGEKFCGQCGQKLKGNSRFCSACGSKQ